MAGHIGPPYQLPRQTSTQTDRHRHGKTTEIDKNRRKSTRIAQKSTFFRHMSTYLDHNRCNIDTYRQYLQKSTFFDKSRRMSAKGDTYRRNIDTYRLKSTVDFTQKMSR